MNRIKSTVFVLLILPLALVTFPQVNLVKTEPNTIVVPDDYSLIQGAINNANEGDTIFVKSGTYNETLFINKSLSLVGEDKYTTIIKAHNPEIVVSIRQDRVCVTGFTILAGETSNPNVSVFPWDRNLHAIQLRDSQYCNITGNILANSGCGIWLYGSYNNHINGNIITNSYFGIDLTDFSSNNIISGNNITNNSQGIRLRGTSGSTSNNTIYRNTLINNEVGVFFQDAELNIIVENTLTTNTDGIIFRASSSNVIYHNNFLNNQRNIDDISWSEWFISPSRNIWENDYPSGGNYWSNYNGTDNDADDIGDTPYFIDENNQDNYPLMSLVDISEIPEFHSGILFPILVTSTLVILIFKSKLKKKVLG